MINNLNILFPEIFLTISIFSALMIGVFIKNSFNLVFNLGIGYRVVLPGLGI